MGSSSLTISTAPKLRPRVPQPFSSIVPPFQLHLLSGRSKENKVGPLIMCCSNSNSTASSFPTAIEELAEDSSSFAATNMSNPAPIVRKRKRYRKPYPGELKGITEEMRFVAMRLHNIKGKYTHNSKTSSRSDDDKNDDYNSPNDAALGKEDGESCWEASMEGFLNYLVDSKLVFQTIERIVDKSEDVSYVYFRRTGLERAEGLAQDIQWFTQQHKDTVIPEPTSVGLTYAKYLQELADKNPPLFLCHFYNIYFSHLAGGQVIAKQVSEKLLEGRELEFYKWEGDEQELLKGVRENLNMLGEHWSRDVKNKCLKEATKSFRHMGQIVRLIIL
ncbi:probable inactive heme oxygenase 2, chloroplastic [Mercurialis annua]|uniref:probable inactive heme oxygenase 2, chloroplastic n=1 Tax=Mercurialis annua TaxID=3986 RepID=UPI00215FC52E|nr:probable inactive heme oxygenase 2, chloroplastic [Mercurialis annua]